MRYFNFTALCCLILFSVSSANSEEKNKLSISAFSTEGLTDWKTKSFLGNTDYQITSIDNTLALQAISHASASGLYKEQRIDLHKTPYLNWSWRINHHLKGLNEQSKSGDDFSARVYIVVSGGWFFWKTKAINYVWASNTAKGDIWPNAFVGKKAMMVPLRSSDDKTHTWYSEKRHILADFKYLFGYDIQYIDAVALMTDTDNSKSDAKAYYDNIYFSAE